MTLEAPKIRLVRFLLMSLTIIMLGLVDLSPNLSSPEQDNVTLNQPVYTNQIAGAEYIDDWFADG